jgi:uncharacterized membrane protein
MQSARNFATAKSKELPSFFYCVNDQASQVNTISQRTMDTTSRKACVVAVASLLVLDFLWLGVVGVGRRFFAMSKRIRGGEAAASSDWKSWQMVLLTVGAYVLLALALCRFAVIPSRIQGKPLWAASASGALLGLVIYGIFDLTNLVVFGRGYGLSLAALDVAWGTFVLAASAFLGILSSTS